MKAKKATPAAKKVAKKTSKPAASKALSKKPAPKAKTAAKKPVKRVAVKASKKIVKPAASKAVSKKVTPKPKAKGRGPTTSAATDHLIMVPPFMAMAEVQGHMSRAQAKEALLQWAQGKPQNFFGDTPFDLLNDKKGNIDIPNAGGSIFTAKLTPAHARLLQKEVGFFVGPRLELVPVPIDGTEEFPSLGSGNAAQSRAAQLKSAPAITSRGGSKKSRGLTTANIEWSGQAITGGSIPREFVRSPVLYVVDSGVQPFLDSDWHPEFKTAIESGRIKIRQGRVPSTLADWPYTMGPPNPWENTPLDDFIVPPATSSPIPPPYPTPPTTAPLGWLNPHLDVVGHGTRIASTAIGETAGFLGKVTITGNVPDTDPPIPQGVHVESIRVYDSGTAYNSDAIEGIYSAIAAHNARIASEGPRPASVLLFASRTNAFDPLLEAALWWAWCQGIVCVVAAGNTATTASPNSRWFTSTGAIAAPATTSPSRFDWISANVSATTRSWWPGSFYPKPCPTTPYLIMVGGTNASQTNNVHSGWWTSTCRGRDVDILAPAGNVAAAMATASLYADGLKAASGTSLSAGYVAGVALTYVGSVADNGTPWPTRFRNWLLPTGGPVATSPCKVVTTGTTPSPSPTTGTTNNTKHHLPTGFTKVPKLFIQAGTGTIWA